MGFIETFIFPNGQRRRVEVDYQREFYHMANPPPPMVARGEVFSSLAMEHFRSKETTLFIRKTIRMNQTTRFYYVPRSMSDKDILAIMIDGTDPEGDSHG